MKSTPFTLRVECYAGYRGEETPRRFYLDDRSIEVEKVVDSWLAPDHRYFKVRAEDDTFILRHDPGLDRWDLVLFAAGEH
jgi:hypothetical protein